MRMGCHSVARVWLAVVLSALLGIRVVSAALIEDTVTTTLLDTPYSQDLFIPLFNPTLGQLTSVRLTVTSQFAGGWEYENTSPTKSSAAFTASFGMAQSLDVTNVTFGSQDYSFATTAATNNITIPAKPKFDGTLDGAGTSGGTISGINTSQTQVIVFNTAPTLAPFIGLGQADFQVVSDETDSVSAHGKPSTVWLGTYSQAGATIDVQYTYTPAVAAVPEPGLAELFSLGLLGLAFTLWRRRKQSRAALTA